MEAIQRYILLEKMNQPATIKESVLRGLIHAGGAVHATIAGRPKGFSVMFKVGAGEMALATSKGQIRLFASLDTAGGFIQGHLGLPRFEVDMTHHEPGLLRKPRPDRAEALRHTRTRMQQQLLEFSNAEATRI